MKYAGLEIRCLNNKSTNCKRKTNKNISKQCFCVFLCIVLCLSVVLFAFFVNYKIKYIGQNSQESELHAESFKKYVFEVFAPQKSNLTQVNANFKIDAPVVYNNIENFGNSVIFYVQKVEVATCGVNGIVKSIVTNSLSRKIEIKIAGDYTVVYSGISIVGVKKGQNIETGTILGSVNNCITVELFCSGKKQTLKFDNGCIRKA